MQPLALEHAALPRACVKSSPGMSRTGNSNPGSGHCSRSHMDTHLSSGMPQLRERISYSSSTMISVACLLTLLLITAASSVAAAPVHNFGGFVTVANRGEGTVSFIDPSTAAVKLTFRLPDDGEPMYIAYDYSDRSRILVADRRNDRLVVAELRGDTVELIRRKSRRFLRLPAGAFHSMSSQFFVTEVRHRNFCALS